MWSTEFGESPVDTLQIPYSLLYYVVASDG